MVVVCKVTTKHGILTIRNMTSRAKHGLLVEVFLPMAKLYFLKLWLQGIFLKMKFSGNGWIKLLHLIWADWAVGQLNMVFVGQSEPGYIRKIQKI